jgi:sugar-phosphatase
VPGRVVRAVLFDLDGVLVESREATERVWLAWALKNGIGEEELLSAMHGVRSVEVVRALRPDSDFVAEAEAIEEAQALDTQGLRAIPGAAEALLALREDRVAAGRAAGAAVVGVTSTHAAEELSAADVVIPTLETLPAVLARSFDAGDVLRANDGH